MVTHCSILAWEIPRTEKSGKLQSMGSKRVRHELVTEHEHEQQETQITEKIKNKNPRVHIDKIDEGLPWRSSGQDSTFPKQGAQV